MADDSGFDELTKEELILELETLEQELREKEETIQSLTAENLRNGKKRGGRDSVIESQNALQITALEEENENLIVKLDAMTEESNQYKEKISDLTAQVKQVNIDRGEAEANLRLARKRVDELEKEISAKNEKTEAVLAKNEEALKNKSHTQKMQLQLYQENEELHNQVKELEERLKDFSVKHSDMEEVIVNLANEKEDLENFRDQSELKEKEQHVRILELERELKTTNDRLQNAAELEGQMETALAELNNDFSAQINQNNEDIKNYKSEIAKLNKEIISLKDSTLIGEKQLEIEQLQNLNRESAELIDELRVEIENLLPEKEQLIERLLSYEENIESRVYDRIAEETEKNRMLDKKIIGLVAKLNEEKVNFEQLEREKDYLIHELEEANHWRVVYESGHGLQELAKHQKRVKEDNRRLTITLEQLTRKLGEAMDNNGILVYSFEKLAAESGKDPSFMYDKHQIQEEMLGENVRVKSQVHELELQVDSLENECIRLRKVLKHQAGAVGEQGFKFTGLSADHLIKINEYAMNLRDGNIELPKEERPIALLKENSKLKEDIKVLNLLVERHERELAGVGSHNVDNVNSSQPAPLSASLSPAKPTLPAPNSSLDHSSSGTAPVGVGSLVEAADIAALRDGMQQLLKENNELRQHMFVMQDEMMLQLKLSSRDQPGVSLPHSMHQPQVYPNAGLFNKTNNAIPAAITSTPVAVSGPTAESPLFVSMIQSQPATEQKIAVTPAAGRTLSFKDQTGEEGHLSAIGMAQQKVLNSGVKQSLIQPAPNQNPNDMFFSPSSTVTAATTPVAKPHQFRVPVNATETPTAHNQSQFNMSMMSGRNNTFASMAFPPDDYAEQLKAQNKQLIECLETLHEREAELEEQRTVTSDIECALIGVQNQLSVVYYDYNKKIASYELKLENLKEENNALLSANEDMKLRVVGIEKTLDMDIKSLDQDAVEAKLLQMSKKLVICDVNELIFSRKYTTLSEQLQQEQDQRIQLQFDIAEIESNYKKRVLYLEQHKAALTNRLNDLQNLVDNSVPTQVYMSVQAELENLRDDHLMILRRDMDDKIRHLNGYEKNIEYLNMKREYHQLKTDRDAEKDALLEAKEQLQYHKQVIDKYCKSDKALNPHLELSSVVSEMAKYKGEASRMEVECSASKRRADSLNDQLNCVQKENEKLLKRVAEVEKIVEDALSKEKIARKAAMELSLKYSNGGWTKDEVDAQVQKSNVLEKQLAEALLDITRQKELADIAFLQAETISSFRQQNQEELVALRDYCTTVESKGDDDFLVGRLQRQLLSTKNSYKAFVRKYQLLRSGMRQRELTLRVLENRLDQREEALASIQDTHRLEVHALKQALQCLEDNAITFGNSGVVAAISSETSVPASDRTIKSSTDTIRQLTMKFNELSVAADKSIKRTLELEEECKSLRRNSQLHADVNKKHEKKIDELQKELQRYTHKSASDKNAEVLFCKLFSETNNKGDHHNAGEGGLNASSMLTSLRDSKSQADALKADNEQLKHTVTSLRELVEVKNKQLDEANHQIFSARSKVSTHNGEVGVVVDNVDDIFRTVSKAAGEKREPKSHTQFSLMKEEQEKLQEAASATIGSLRSLLEEKNEIIARNERKVTELQSELNRANHISVHAGAGGKYCSAADRQAAALLSQMDRELIGGGDGNTHDDHRGGGQSATVERLHKANDELFNIITEKDKTLAQLEERLLAESNSRERAELRCGSCINEMEAMKADIITLVNQLKESEKRIQALNSQTRIPQSKAITHSPAVSTVAPVANVDVKDRQKLFDLQNTVKSKDKKMKEYRDIIVKLKNEFLRQEEERAENLKHAEREPRSSNSAVNTEELNLLRKQVSALRDGLSQAKEEMERARKSREKLAVALRAAEGRVDSYENEMQNAQELAATAQQSLAGCRRERDEALKKEVRMREKLKEFLSDERDKIDGGPADSIAKQLSDHKDKVKQLEKNVEILRIQNMALRRANTSGEMVSAPVHAVNEELSGTVIGSDSKSVADRPQSAPNSTPSNAINDFKESAGNRLGVKDTFGSRDDSNTASGGIRDVRAERHARWEEDKKLQHRLTVLNRRVKEMDDENNNLRSQLKEWRDKATKEMQSKHDSLKHSSNVIKKITQDNEQKRVSNSDVHIVEDLRSQIFELEEECAKWKRKAEVEMSRELTTLRHQVSVLHTQKSDLEEHVEDLEARCKQLQDYSKGTSLRQSEDKYHKEQKMYEEIDKLKRHKVELESVLLDRDTSIMEMRFEEEQHRLEVERLRGRTKEVESALKIMKQGGNVSISPGVESSSTLRKSTTGPGKKAPVSGADAHTIETMSRMIEELRKENNRLKASKDAALGDKRLQSLEKALSNEKHKNENLQTELHRLEAKIRDYAGTEQTLVQRQQRITSLQKQIKKQQEEYLHLKADFDQIQDDNLLLHEEISRQQKDMMDETKRTLKEGTGKGENGIGLTTSREQEHRLQDLKELVEKKDGDILRLRDEVHEYKDKVDRLSGELKLQQLKRADVDNSNNSLNSVPRHVAAELEELRQENSRMHEELDVLDADFFEEIENLKYNYQETLKKVSEYEKRFGPLVSTNNSLPRRK